MSLIERDAEIEAGWNALGYRRNPQHDVFIADGINRLRATHSEAMEDMRQQLQGAVEALREIVRVVDGVERGEPFGDDEVGSLPPLPYVGGVARRAIGGR